MVAKVQMKYKIIITGVTSASSTFLSKEYYAQQVDSCQDFDCFKEAATTWLTASAYEYSDAEEVPVEYLCLIQKAMKRVECETQNEGQKYSRCRSKEKKRFKGCIRV